MQGTLSYPLDSIGQVDREGGMPYQEVILKDGMDKRGVNPQQVRGGYSTTFIDAKSNNYAVSLTPYPLFH